MPVRVILDTDIGTDVDDALALALILTSPEIALEGVTCVYGDVNLRAKMALKLLRLRGIEHVPVTLGVSKPLLNRRPIYWEGHEGQGLLSEEDDLRPSPESAVDFIVRTVLDHPAQIHLVAIGPLTNIALALLREPRLASQVAGITIMGGVVRGMDRLDLPYAEHNILCDPEAAHIVLTSGAPLTLVPLDITTQVRITPDGVARIRAGGTPFHDAVARQVELYPRFQRHGHTALHDPLAVATLIDASLVRMRPLHVDVELRGDFAAGATLMRLPHNGEQATANVVVGVDIPRFEAFLPSRIAR